MNIDITQVPPTSAVIEQHRVKLGVKERRKTLVLGFLFVTAPLAFAVSLVSSFLSGTRVFPDPLHHVLRRHHLRPQPRPIARS